jgi:two-component system, OmpR family, KDP operon response regulator KdpE
MSPESFQILVASSDLALRREITEILNSAGFHIIEAQREQEAITVVRRRRVDLVVLVCLPNPEAQDTCRALRALLPGLGILVIRVGGSMDDAGAILDAGADDCIGLPIRFREVIAHIRAVLQRTRLEVVSGSIITAGELELHVDGRVLKRAGTPVHLSPTEFDLLLFLMSHQGVSLTHMRILRAVWGERNGNALDSLRAYVTSLRHKVEPDPAHPQFIITEPWVGYRFNNPSSSV